jgi:hypothetical protein
MAVTVDAPPEDIWPWLVQIGYQRGGLYSYDWLDRLFGVSRSCVRTNAVCAQLFTYAIEPAGFLMTRRMLLGVKERAEALRAGRTGTHGGRRAA